jgi:predicted transcriptional regulator
MSKKQTRPTDSELEILQILWRFGPSTVRLVNDELNRRRPVGYTTTLKLMQIMSDKKLVTRNTAQRTHIYYANVLEDDVQNGLIQKVIHTAFQGSAMKLIMQALGNQPTSAKELAEIKALIEKMESQS